MRDLIGVLVRVLAVLVVAFVSYRIGAASATEEETTDECSEDDWDSFLDDYPEDDWDNE